jgi:hypothetical protein
MTARCLSPLAKTPPGHEPLRRPVTERARSITRFVVHMTGSSIVSKAVRRGTKPVDACLDYYCANKTSSHYLIDLDGTIYALTDERIRVGHVGVYADERRCYLDGSWAQGALPKESPDVKVISREAVAQWHQAWPAYESPQHLFSTRSINDCSVASEMPPAGYYVGGIWRQLPGVELWGGTRHTVEQHVAVAQLALDLATRHAWPAHWLRDQHGGPRTPWVLGHEDVDLFGRADAGGGWDPGALRSRARWDWWAVYCAIGILRVGATRDDAVHSLRDYLTR